jgi:mRNA interferase RelE/StbE
MKVEFKKPFLKELKKLKNKKLKNSILNCILQIEKAENVTQIKNIKKLIGFDVYYRIRVGD